MLAEKVVFAGIRGGHFLGREVAILLAEGWSLLAERVVFVGRRHVFLKKTSFWWQRDGLCWQNGCFFIQRHYFVGRRDGLSAQFSTQ